MPPPKQNKAILLKAFDTRFNKRDYEAAERFKSHLGTSSTARTSDPAAQVSSILFARINLAPTPQLATKKCRRSGDLSA